MENDFEDVFFMHKALEIAESKLGISAPNPAVGCILVKDGLEISRGSTGVGGRPHAEVSAINLALQKGIDLKGAKMIVSLEPCSHQGVTAPCVQAIIEAGISKVVAATEDPDPRVCGLGLEMLRSVGIEVVCGLLQKEAKYLNRGFFKVINENKPLVIIKMALTIDSMAAASNGRSKWITCEESRALVAKIRGSCDMIAAGSGTIRTDDPQLNCRIPNEDRRPKRVIFTTSGDLLSSNMKVFSGVNDTWILCLREFESLLSKRFPNNKVIGVPAGHDGIDIELSLRKLAESGITRLLVEGGPKIWQSFINMDLFDEMIIFRAPKIAGTDALPAFGSRSATDPQDFGKVRLVKLERSDKDVVEYYERHSFEDI